MSQVSRKFIKTLVENSGKNINLNNEKLNFFKTKF